MEKKYDVTALGELLIDFAVNGESEQGNQLFEACPGGAPCNVLAMLNKLGRKTAFIGKVGDDQFGKLLKDTITNTGIEAKGLVMDQDIHTTLAFVHTFPDGDREFSFYRKPGADMMLKEEEVDYDLIRQSKVFHFGTLSMTDEPVKTATKRALSVAKEAGCMITFDPNLRPPLWKTLDEAKEQMEYGFENCDVLKISDNEIQVNLDARVVLNYLKDSKEKYIKTSWIEMCDKLKKCLIDYDLKNINIYVVDNHSSDDTLERLLKFKEKNE